jgi:hypothetical protein
MGLKDLLKGGGGGMRDPVRGTAHVVSASMNRGRGILQTCDVQLVVQADGVQPTAVAYRGLVHRDRWPVPGMVLPVTVDRAEPQHLEIEWDEVEPSEDRTRWHAEDLAATMRAEGADGGPAGGATVVNLSGRELPRLSEEQKAKLRVLGLDPDALVGGAGAAAPERSPPADDTVDERLERLERLVRLREQGALTDEEFEAQKRRVLEA